MPTASTCRSRGSSFAPSPKGIYEAILDHERFLSEHAYFSWEAVQMMHPNERNYHVRKTQEKVKKESEEMQKHNLSMASMMKKARRR